MDTKGYCQAWRDAGKATCDKKVRFYFGRTNRATLPFQYEFSCDAGEALRLCKKDADDLYTDCLANDGISMYPRSTRKRCRHRPEHWSSLPSCTCLDAR